MLSADYFGIRVVPPWEWQEADLKALIDDRVPENLHIDYKDSRLLGRQPQSKKDDCVEKLTKEVSAFNNSDGGVIVVGLQTDKSEGKVYPKLLDDGVTESEFNKTWLVQIINSNVSPPIPGLRVHPVKLHREHQGKVAYVIYVPKGLRAVQAKDLRYYHRIEDQSLPMRDYQISDVNNRTEGPDLKLSFGLAPGTNHAGREGSIRFLSEVYANNLAQTPAELAQFTVVVPTRLKPDLYVGDSVPVSRHALQPKMRLEYRTKPVEASGAIFSWCHSQVLGMPAIFKGLKPSKIAALHLVAKQAYQHVPHFEPFVWIAESPRMEPRSGCNILAIDVINDAVEFSAPDDARVSLDDMEPLDWWRRMV